MAKGKKKRTNIIKSLSDTIKGAFTELKTVQWTKPRELLNLVLFTLIVTGVVAAIMVAVDGFFKELVSRLLAL